MTLRTGSFGGLVFGALFAVVGYFVAFSFGKPILDNATASNDWPRVPGVIEHSKVATSRSGGKTMYQADVQYRYRVDDHDRTGSTIFFGDDVSTSGSGPAQKLVDRYPKGAKVDVHYNPKEPATAVLEPGARWQSYVVFGIGLAFLVVGVLTVSGAALYLLLGGLIIGGALVGAIGGSRGSSTAPNRFGPSSPGRDLFSAPPDDRDSADAEDDGFDVR